MIVRFPTELSLGLKGSAKSKDELYCRLSLVRLLFSIISFMLLLPEDFGSVYAKIGEKKVSGNWQGGHGGSGGGLVGGMPSWKGVDAPQKVEKAVMKKATGTSGNERNLQAGDSTYTTFRKTGLDRSPTSSPLPTQMNENEEWLEHYHNGAYIKYDVDFGFGTSFIDFRYLKDNDYANFIELRLGDVDGTLIAELAAQRSVGGWTDFENARTDRVNFDTLYGLHSLYLVGVTHPTRQHRDTAIMNFHWIEFNASTVPTGIGEFNITREGGISVTDQGASETVKVLGIKYLVSRMGGIRGTNTFASEIRDQSCTDTLGATFPLTVALDEGDSYDLNITYNPVVVEADNRVWNSTTNEAGIVTGGTFGFCLRVEVLHSTYEVNFLETKFNATVDKTQGFNTLNIDVDRTEATNENVTNVDYDADLEAYKCNVATKDEDTSSVSQGSILGLCVLSDTSGIDVVGWQDLSLKNSAGIEFPAIVDGSIGTGLNNLVTQSCNEDEGFLGCTAQVQLVSGFFTEDGSFNATGTVILGLSEARRQLEKATDTYSQRTLEEEGGSGTFEISIEMDSPVSAASSMNAPHLQIITFGLVSLLAFALY